MSHILLIVYDFDLRRFRFVKFRTVEEARVHVLRCNIPTYAYSIVSCIRTPYDGLGLFEGVRGLQRVEENIRFAGFSEIPF